MDVNRTIALVACGLLATTMWAQEEKKAAPAKPASDAKPATEAKPRDPGLYAIMTTSMGTMVIKLYEKEAPITVKNFVDLALGRKAWKDPNTGQMVRKPLFNGLMFHRVIPGFMIQGGDPTGTGAGDVGFTIEDEFVPTLKFDQPGRLGMANTGAPHTGASQFFITEVPTPHLSGKHTIFGQVVEGEDLVGKIARVPRDNNDKPRTPVRIVKIEFKREGPVPPNAPEGAARPAAPAKKTTSAPAKKTATPPTTPAKK
jgi:peptidyl-prolyl cis-trans isomerase A (cyclophilin A)